MSRLLKRLGVLGLFCVPFSLFADVDTLEIDAPKSAKINEAIDLTLRAVDSTGSVVTDFEGEVLFLVEGDDDAVIPFEDGYSFELSDQGEHTFSKGFTFTTAGEIQIYVYELETDIEAVHSITILEGGDERPDEVDVTIISPQNNTTIGSSTVSIQGSTKETSSIDVYLNGEKNLTSQTDADGKFQEDVTGLIEGENVIYVEVFDGSNNRIGVSENLELKLVDDLPSFESLIIREGEEVWVSQQITLEMVAEPGLKEASASIGSTQVVLEEEDDNLGTYLGTTRASEFEGEYKINVALENTLGGRYEESDVTRFSTIDANIENIKVETTEDSRVRFTFDVVPDLDQIQYFQIDLGNKSGEYTQSITTFQKDKIREENKYTWYIPDLENGEYFATIIGLDANKNETPVISPETSFVINLEAPPTECFIDNVGGVYVETFDTYSVIHWNKLPDAEKYLVFKKNTSGKYTMIDQVTENQYTVHIDMTYPNIRYEEFSIKATCKEGELDGESYDFSKGVAVQTGPELLILFVLMVASGVAFVLLKRGYIQ